MIFLKSDASSLSIKKIHTQHSIERVAVKRKFYPGILIVKNEIMITDTFRFEPVALSAIQNEIKSFSTNKATTHNNIPLKILRQSVEAIANALQFHFKNDLSNSEFPENLKPVDVTPVLKKKDTYMLAFYLQKQKSRNKQTNI